MLVFIYFIRVDVVNLQIICKVKFIVHNLVQKCNYKTDINEIFKRRKVNW